MSYVWSFLEIFLCKKIKYILDIIIFVKTIKAFYLGIVKIVRPLQIRYNVFGWTPEPVNPNQTLSSIWWFIFYTFSDFLLGTAVEFGLLGHWSWTLRCVSLYTEHHFLLYLSKEGKEMMMWIFPIWIQNVIFAFKSPRFISHLSWDEMFRK